MLVKTTKALLKLVSNAISNLVSSSELIAHRCLILANLQDRIDLKNRSLNDQMTT